MQEFEFNLKTKLCFGRGKALKLGEYLKELGFQRIGLIVDSAIFNLGYTKDILEKLKEHSFQLIIREYNLKAEPDYDSLDKVRMEFLDENKNPRVDCFIGIGGGSVIDFTKGLATLVNNLEPARTYKGFPKNIKPSLATIALPTTAGTGSEVTYNAVFIDLKENKKLGINTANNFPVLAVLDSKLIAGSPKKIIASSGMDALVHSLESYIAVQANYLTKIFAKEAFKLVFNNLPKFFDDDQNLEAIEKLQLGAFLAGISLMNSGSGPAGALSYTLGVHFKVPHGIAGAVFIPHTVRHNTEKGYDYSELYDLIDDADKNIPKKDKSRAFAEKLFELCEKLGIPKTIREFGVSQENINLLFADVDNFEKAFAQNPIPFTTEDGKNLLRKMTLNENKFLEGKKIKIYLCDLAHNYIGQGSWMFPLNIGYIGAYAKEVFGEKIEIELFKYPAEFISRCKKEIPDVVGFSHYLWNQDLNKRLSEWIKSISPETIIIFGGPNIDNTQDGYKKFFNSCKSTDFFIPYQGETPFINLLKEAFRNSFHLKKMKLKPIDGVIYSHNDSNNIVIGKSVLRIKNLDQIPSPYLTGILDKFFNTNLIPTIETNRGCPWKCTFCCQGFQCNSQLEFFGLERVKKELSYIAYRVKNTDILLAVDANFGIVERDFEIARFISELRKNTGYPHKFSSSLAKNQPKLFELSKILKNIIMVMSVQSLNEMVLKNVKRQNINISIFKDNIDRINSEGGISMTEIILGLPGETREIHLETIKKLFEWETSYICCFNCLLLPGSELSLQKQSGEFKCKTKFRLMDSAFGKYDDITSFEFEEGIRSTETMSEEEILYFRPIHWLIQFMWNYRFYQDLLKYLHSSGINPLDFIIRLVDNIDNAPGKVKDIFFDFRTEAIKEWFDSPELLREYYSQPEHFQWLIEGNHGKMNGKYTFRIILEAQKEFEDYLYQTAINYSELCNSKKEIIKELLDYLSVAIINFNRGFEEISKEKSITSRYNILEWKKDNYHRNLEKFYHPQGEKFIFYLSPEQKKSLNTLLKQYEHKNKSVTLRKMAEYMDITDIRYRTKIVV